jgi:predicted Fe-Mo cluster-binding NifX family protein
MKIAISSTGKDLNSEVSDVFGRCPYFIIAELENKKITKFEALENTNANQAGGAGISAAQTVADKKVESVITQNLGPRAADVLKQFGIVVYEGQGTIKSAVQNLAENKLKKIQ